MHYLNQIIYACVAFQVVFQGASGAILRRQTSGADSVQLPASDLNSLSLVAEDLNNELDSFLRNWGGGHRKPDIVEIANIAKRQTGSIQISPEDLQDLLRLIQSIERQLSAIIASGGSSASGTFVPPVSNTVSNGASETVSNTGPVSDTGPVSSSTAPSIIQPTATEPNPTAIGYVYEDGPSAVPRVVRSFVEVDEDDMEDSESSSAQDFEQQDDDWEPWVEFDGTTVDEDGSDVGFTTRDTWTSLGVTRRAPEGVSPRAEPLFARDEETS
ncbi:hypothetical protein LZ30DRAFT_585349 [Colletotrichum cereale]|nr:hypothetical protein LZ30DRAFT_585349 [Colletotrichum cereale]